VQNVSVIDISLL